MQISALAALSTTTVTDSNSVGLTREANQCIGSTICVADYDYVVPSGTAPTGTYTVTGATLAHGAAYDLTHATLFGASYTGQDTTGLTTSPISASLTAPNKSIQIGLADDTAAVGTPVVTMSNGTYVQVVTNEGGYAIATSTASSTFTWTPGTSLTNPTLIFADYESAQPMASWLGAFIPAPDWRSLCAKAA